MLHVVSGRNSCIYDLDDRRTAYRIQLKIGSGTPSMFEFLWS